MKTSNASLNMNAKERKKYLQFLQSETPSSSDLGIVFQGLRVDDWAERTSGGTGEHSHGLLLAH